MSTRSLIGRVIISSINQIGENVRYDEKSDSFILGRSPSVFDLYAHSEPGQDLPDFRSQSSVKVSFVLRGKVIAVDAASGKCYALDISPGQCPPNAVLECVKRKFDNLSASISFEGSKGKLWFRHSNSRIKV